MEDTQRTVLRATTRFIVALVVALVVLYWAFFRNTGDPQIFPRDVVGTWELYPDLFHLDHHKRDSYHDLRVTILSNGYFTAEGVPPGIFLDEENHRSREGTWNLRYDRYNYIDFWFNGSPGRANGVYGTPLEWDHGHLVFRVGGQYDLVFLARTKVPTEGEQPGAGQPASKPADKPPVKYQPSTLSSKDGPRLQR